MAVADPWLCIPAAEKGLKAETMGKGWTDLEFFSHTPLKKRKQFPSHPKFVSSAIQSVSVSTDINGIPDMCFLFQRCSNDPNT